MLYFILESIGTGEMNPSIVPASTRRIATPIINRTASIPRVLSASARVKFPGMAKPGVVSQRQHRSDVGAVESKKQKRADSESCAECERVDRDANVVSHDHARAFLVSLVEAFPPGRFGFNVRLTKCRLHADKLRELRIVTSGDKTEDRKDREDREREKGIAPRAPERLRQLVSKKPADAFAALRVSTIDATMRADNEAVQIVDETRIARLGARDGEIGSSATIDAPQLANLFTVQTTQ